MGTVLQDRCVAHVVLVIVGSRYFSLCFISPGYGQTGLELLFVLVVVDAFVQLVAGLMVSMTLFCVPS